MCHPRRYDDVLACLASLRARGLRVGALTNGNADVFACPTLAPLFDFSVSAADAGAMKPHLAPFLAAAAAAEVPPNAIVHVGDSPESDVSGALAAGMRAVLLDRRGSADTAVEPHATIASLAELETVLDGWAT